MTDFKRTYSLVDVAERLGKPRTTVADWARQFKEYLPTVGSGRTMRYSEDALEVFGLILKMKDANEPMDSIKEQLRGVVREIIVPTNDDDGKPYLMQLSGEVDQLKKAVVMLAEQLQTMTTENAELKRELDDFRQEAAAGTEKLSEQILEVQDSIREEIGKGQQGMSEQLGELISRVDTYGKQRRGLFGWFK